MEPERAAAELFAEFAGGAPTHLVRSPGRVNLIGDHTDYNDGFVMPLAIDRVVFLAFRPRGDATVAVASQGRGSATFAVDPPHHGDPPWSEHVRGVAWSSGARVGWDGAVAADLPVGAGLSSSAALQLAAAAAFAVAGDTAWDPKEAAIAAQRAENDWVGMPCGIMDQLVIACAEEGRALFIDCRDLTIRPRPLPDAAAVVILDTGTRRDLVDSAYEERRAACRRAAQALGLPALRDADERDAARLPAGLRAIARHVVTENARTVQAAEAMETGDAAMLGRLMVESHASLRDDFGASTPALDAMVEAALRAPGCFGARLTGAGFGGSAVALVERDALARFAAAVVESYPGDGTALAVQASAGLRVKEAAA